MKNILAIGFIYLCSAELALAAGGEHGGEHKSGGLPQLDPSTYAGQTFWLLIVFAVLYVFFSKKTLPEISRTLQSRQERIQSDLENAENLRKEVEAVHTSYEESLSGARAEAAKAYADVDAAIQAQSQELIEDLRQRAEREVDALEARISSAVKEVMNDMEQIAAQIAAEATTKIINVPVSEKEALDVVSALSKTPSKKASKAA